jgi:hypothetical protein
MHAPVRPQFSSDVETQSAEPRRASSERWATRSAWRGRQNAGGSAELESLSDDTLVARLRAQLGDEREACARVLRLMAEVDRRRLYAQAACSSMFDYATRVLGLSESAAYKRIRAARLGREYPTVFERVERGTLHLSGLCVLAPHLTRGPPASAAPRDS